MRVMQQLSYWDRYFKNKNYIDLIQLKNNKFSIKLTINIVKTKKKTFEILISLFLILWAFLICFPIKFQWANIIQIAQIYYIEQSKQIQINIYQDMFKAIILAAVASFAVNAFDVQNLSDQEKKIDSFFRDNMKLDGYTLTDGQTTDNTYTYQYMSGDVPITITQATLQDNNGQFEITNVVNNQRIPTESGSIVSSVSARSSSSLDDAIGSLGWDE